MKKRNHPKSSLYAVIMAGGQGTRFWPLSRRDRPKQFLKMFGPSSLLQQTVNRLRGLIPKDKIYIVTYEKQAAETRKHVPQLSGKKILAEPVQRNTAAAIALAAHVLARQDPKAMMLVLPADHLIQYPAKFHQAVRRACRVASVEENSVLLGIPPAHPETGFGYLKLSRRAAPGYGPRVHRVEQFTEKPDLKKAKRFLASGRYAWNTGIFVWYASTFLANLRKHLPRTAKLLSAGEKHWGKRTWKSWLARTYPQLENISVDYGVMEKASRVYAVQAPIGWSDVGSWQAVYRQQKKDRTGSVLPAASIAFDSKGNYIAAEGKFVATIGVEDLVVVDTDDALLVCRRDRSEDVGKIVRELKKKKRTECL